MVVLRSALFLFGIGGLALGGCAFDPDLAGQYACGTDDACPPGLTCATDHLCRERADADDDLATRATVLDLGPGCTQSSCSDAHCGDFVGACGQIVSCSASCNGKDQICGGDGPNRCGNKDCKPATCATLGKTCGRISDGCAHVLDCGPPC